MKIDRSKLKKCTSEVPPECAALIERLRACRVTDLSAELAKIESWTFGKCELYHWIEVLDVFDGILAEAARHTSDSCWVLSCDYLGYPDHYARKRLLLLILHFTTLLIEHSFSRHLYNSMEHLIWLLSSDDMHVVLGVLNLLYMFSKRSNFIPRLNTEKRHALINRLIHLAESWGGKENGFGLAECCKNVPISSFPPGATTLHFEFYANSDKSQQQVESSKSKGGNVVVTIHLDDVDAMKTPLGDIMQLLITTYDVPADKQMLLLTHLRLAHCFSNHELRLLCVQARLQALSVLVYSNAITEYAHFLLYRGLLEELVEVLELPDLVEIRAAALRTLTSVIHLERNPHVPHLMSGRRLNMIIRVTGAGSYHGFLPVMVRTCISSLTSTSSPPLAFPLPLATALFSFLYHMASYEAGGEALVTCGMMESLLKVIRWPGSELEHITFVTRAVRVIDLITNIEMQAFQMHGGLLAFISRLELEVSVCRKEQPFVIKPSTENEETADSPQEAVMDVEIENEEAESGLPRTAKPCLPQRAALLKSMLNFLKKAIQDPAFADSIRHVMDGSLPSSLKHVISNAEYYGPSLFLLATDVVTVYVFQEPSLLSSLQDNGLTDVVLHALLVKEVPATREVLGSLPNVFSALCLNARGLSAFVRCCPFERLFKVLLSPVYLAAMRRRRSSDPMGDTASNLGNAMDELMRHQPSLKADATYAIIKLLEELCNLGRDPKYVCWRPQSKADMPIGIVRHTGGGGSSDDEEEEEDDETTQSRSEDAEEQPVPVSLERIPIPLVDYILNVMKFVDAILSNNSTDDHCREFVNQRGLQPLISILGLPNLPVDCPVTSSAQAVASVCKSILNLAHEPQVLEEGQRQVEKVLQDIYVLINPDSESTVTCRLLKELAECANPDEALNMDSQTPLLHMVAACQSYTVMLIHVCRTGQSDIRAINICRWGTPFGLRVLDQFMKVYEHVMWESNCLLAFSGDEIIDPRNDFGLDDVDKLKLPDEKIVMQTTSKTWKVAQAADNGMTSAMEALSTDPPVKMDVDPVDELIKPEALVRPVPTPNQLKYISPLLTTASRLGRTMAELFALLVKLCVGSPLRQRRGQIGPISATAVHYAHEVASRLSTVLRASLSYRKFEHAPTALLRLTYLNSTMGYVAPLLFDDKKFPYHLMLNEFIKSDSHRVFFESFEWVLKDNPSLPWGVVTLEFVENWLELLEKLVNPKTLLESPHAMPPTKAGSTVPASFDPIKYLVVMQKLAFDALMLVWNQDTKLQNRLGARIASVSLLIWRHILRAEIVIEERSATKNKETTAASAAEPAAAPNNADSAPAVPAVPRNNEDPDVSQEFLNRLVDMGFNREMSIQALRISPTVEQATEYLLNAPFSNTMEMEVSEEDQVHQAIAMSLGETDPAATPKTGDTPLKAKQREDAEVLPLTKEEIDKFTVDAAATCLFLLDILGSSAVFRVCDLLVIIVKRNGNEFRDNMLRLILNEVTSNVETLLEQVASAAEDTLQVLMNSEAAKKTAIRLHVFSLLFEEMKAPSAVAVQELHVIDLLVHLLSKAEPSLSATQTPKWLAPLLLLLDLFEKVAISTKRKNAMHKMCSRQWKWYDLGTGKWCPYNASHNKLINQSYWSGEPSIRINYGRRKYTLQFSCMYQSNDETGNRRPIMMALSDKSCVDNEEMEVEVETKDVVVDGIGHDNAASLIKSCVFMLKIPIENDALHALMRICLRITRDYEHATRFAQLGGVKVVLNLTFASHFAGFASLSTLLIRHVMEEPHVLRQAMEKVLKAKTQTNIPPPYKELFYMLRMCGNAICRDPEIFLKLAKETLKVDVSILSKRNEEEDTRLLLKMSPPASQQASHNASEEQVSTRVISDLLDALVVPPVEISDAKSGSSETPEVPSPKAGGNVRAALARQGLLRNSPSAGDLNNAAADTDEQSGKAESNKTSPKKTVSEDTTRPLIPRSSVLKILAEAVRSYSHVCKLVINYSYPPNASEYVSEQGCTALSFILDNLLRDCPRCRDVECANMARMLIASLASCNHSADTQTALVVEVKGALLRALGQPESATKHIQVQQLCNLVSVMIDNCPPTSQSANKANNCGSVNNVVRLMQRKGLIVDLARIPHSLDLSSPSMHVTVNSALKPLETLSRLVNHPVPPPPASKNNKLKGAGPATQEAGAQTTVSGSDATLAQGEEASEDPDNTEHDISAAGESLADNSAAAAQELMEVEAQQTQGGEEEVSDSSGGDDSDSSVGGEKEEESGGGGGAEEDLDSDDMEEEGASEDDGIEEEEDDDEEDDDDDDEGEEDENEDEGGGSGYEDIFESDDGLFRVPGLDREAHDDIFMIQYSEPDTAMPLVLGDNNRSFQLPYGLFEEPAGENAAPFPVQHPLMGFRANSLDVGNAQPTRAQRANRQRRYQYLQLNARNPNPPVILQRLLGPGVHDLPLSTSQALASTFRDTRVVVMDSGLGLFNSEEDNADGDQPGYLFGPSLAATLNNIPNALHWWNEEGKLLDGDSMPACVIATCAELVDRLEEQRDKELAEKKEKKQKQAEEEKKKEEDKPAAAAAESKMDVGKSETASLEITASEETALAAELDRIDQSILETEVNNIVSSVLRSSTAALQGPTSEEAVPEESVVAPDAAAPTTTTPMECPPTSGSGVAADEEEEPAPAAAESSEQLPRNVFEELDLDAAESWFRSQMEVQPRLSPAHSDENLERSGAAESERPPPTSSGTPATAAPPEIPDGVDPSFLAALPEEMRQEVIAEQLRLQRLQQRARTAHANGGSGAAESSATASVLEVNPEFLAALPPNIQEEVLSQQRLEQQRQAAAAANPNDPVDAAAFFHNLTPTLRQAILTDMEESQISVLPPELAAEAQSLRRDWEARNRQIMQERFFSHGNSALSSILRNPGRIPGRYAIHSVPQRQWGQWGRQSSEQFAQCNRHKGKPVLDHEALACLLVLLFVDEPNLNITRLQRVLRNLCYHGPTRDWITKALTCILEKCNECHSPDGASSLVTRHGGAILIDQCPTTNSLTIRQTTSKCESTKSPWLNITMDAALGSRANVFYVQRGKRAQSIAIHPQATSTVVKHALDTYVSLAKVFPTFYFPSRLGGPDTVAKTSTSKPCPQSDFWEVLLKLDSSTKKGKSVPKTASASLAETDSSSDISKHFQQLLAMLGFPVIRRSTQLTDKMLRLANAMAQGVTETPNCNTVVVPPYPSPSPDSFHLEIPVHLLKLTVDVLTSKSCSEEGLEDATAFLLNMTSGPVGIRNVIVSLLLEGAKELGAVVGQHIAVLMEELKELTKTRPAEDEDGAHAVEKGKLQDRFTNSTVIVNAPSKVKGGCELQLPSMAALTSKTSSQAFFLRVLKVIMQLKDAMKANVKRGLIKKEEISLPPGVSFGAEENSAPATADAPSTEPAAVPAPKPSDEGEETKAMDTTSKAVELSLVPCLSEQLNVDRLWDTLSLCLLELEHTPDHYAVLVLQPAVEAFFLVHSSSIEKEKVVEKGGGQQQPAQPPRADLAPVSPLPREEDSSSSSSSSSVQGATAAAEQPLLNVSLETAPAPALSPDTIKFLKFAEMHRTVLNQILRQSSVHLADGPFHVLVDHTRMLDFDVKRRYFRIELERLDEGIRREELAVHVRRSHVFEDSFRELHRRSADEWKNRFYIVFEGEEGQDAGGLLREWYVIISREIFNPMYALFSTSPGDRVTYMINSTSHCNPNHLSYFKFVGRVIAKAIYDNKLLECYFTRSFYKHILGILVKYTDMESEDYSFYKGLVYLMENHVSEIGYDLAFSTEVQEFGVTETRDLIPNGRNVAVTEAGKMEYVRLVCQMKMTGAIRKQLNAFLEGFYDIIPKRLISIFNEQELELLISGLPNVDIEDLKANTEYHKYQSTSLQIQWFWRALRSLDQADRAKFLQFVTGTSKVPLQGFGALEGMNGVQKFQIHRDDRSTDRLPSAHTCFNQLDLPVYETYDKLRSYLLKAIHECSEGFGFA